MAINSWNVIDNSFAIVDLATMDRGSASTISIHVTLDVTTRTFCILKFFLSLRQSIGWKQSRVNYYFKFYYAVYSCKSRT
jgi:hypothetical protein